MSNLFGSGKYEGVRQLPRMIAYVPTRAEWRSWLEQNSQTEKSIWLILYHKKSKVPGISIEEATERLVASGLMKGRARS